MLSLIMNYSYGRLTFHQLPGSDNEKLRLGRETSAAKHKDVFLKFIKLPASDEAQNHSEVFAALKGRRVNFPQLMPTNIDTSVLSSGFIKENYPSINHDNVSACFRAYDHVNDHITVSID